MCMCVCVCVCVFVCACIHTHTHLVLTAGRADAALPDTHLTAYPRPRAQGLRLQDTPHLQQRFRCEGIDSLLHLVQNFFHVCPGSLCRADLEQREKVLCVWWSLYRDYMYVCMYV